MSSLSSQYVGVVIPTTLEDLFANEIAGASLGAFGALLVANSPGENRQIGVEREFFGIDCNKIWARVEIVEVFSRVALDNGRWEFTRD